MNSLSLALLATVGSLLALSPPSRAQADDGPFPSPSAVQAASRAVSSSANAPPEACEATLALHAQITREEAAF